MTIRILYNAECPICNAEICHYRAYAEKRDIPFGFDDLNIIDPSEYGVTQDQAARRLHILHEGQVYSGMAAFRIIWAQMPRYRFLAWITSAPVLNVLFDKLYDGLLAPWLYGRHIRRLNQG
jgi:predicted DCC family thiol-disulfide oxidoreductase YuxK